MTHGDVVTAAAGGVGLGAVQIANAQRPCHRAAEGEIALAGRESFGKVIIAPWQRE